MMWSYAVSEYYSQQFNRHDYFRWIDVDPTKYKRDVPAVYENDQSENIPGLIMIPYFNLIRHKNYQVKSKEKKTVYNTIKNLNIDQLRFEKYAKRFGIKMNDKAPPITGKFDDNPIYDYLYFTDRKKYARYQKYIRLFANKLELVANRKYKKG